MSTFVSGYKFMRKILPIPAISTILRLLRSYKTSPGVNLPNIQAMRAKLHLSSTTDKLCWILMDEMSLRKGLRFDPARDKIWRYQDDGENRTEILVNRAMCVMVAV